MMNLGFWEKLKKPFYCLAPMSDVTDVAFRHMLSKYGKNRENKNEIVFWTEFVSADGLCDKLGRKKLSHILKFKENERPIVAQVFTANPENMKKACQYIASLGFDGIDINMGCPDKSVVSQGAGAGLIKNPQLARKIIQGAHAGIKTAGLNIPVSVKTRIGFNKEEINTWIGELLKEDIAALTIHLRTAKELSLVPAEWKHLEKIKELIKKSGKEVLLIGNGDVKDLQDAKEKAFKYGCDGIMIGRGIFGNPWFFNNFTSVNFSPLRPSLGAPGSKRDPRGQKIHTGSVPEQEQKTERDSAEETSLKEAWERDGASTRNFSAEKYPCSFKPVSLREKLEALVEHTQIFDKELLKPKHKNFAVMKKHFKAYVNGFEGSKELRIKLMETENSEEVEKVINDFLTHRR